MNPFIRQETNRIRNNIEASKKTSSWLAHEDFLLHPHIVVTRRTGLDSKIVREVRDIAMKLPAWRFLLLSSIALLVAAGYFVGNVPWDKFL